MTKRTTLVLDDKVYERLVKESMSRFGNAKNISKVVNELVQSSGDKKDKQELLRLIYAKKVARTTASDFERFRRQLSSRIEKD